MSLLILSKCLHYSFLSFSPFREDNIPHPSVCVFCVRCPELTEGLRERGEGEGGGGGKGGGRRGEGAILRSYWQEPDGRDGCSPSPLSALIVLIKKIPIWNVFGLCAKHDQLTQREEISSQNTYTVQYTWSTAVECLSPRPNWAPIPPPACECVPPGTKVEGDTLGQLEKRPSTLSTLWISLTREHL